MAYCSVQIWPVSYLLTGSEFVVRQVCRTHRELGVGANGSMEELEADGTIYTGKRIRDALVELKDNLVAEDC